MSATRSYKYYEILELKKENSPSPEEIRSSYRKMALKYHPDKNGGAEWATKKFQELSDAWETLSDPVKKRNYDLFGDKTDDNYSNNYSYKNYNYGNWNNFYSDWKKDNYWWDEFDKDYSWNREAKEDKDLRIQKEEAIDYIVKRLFEENISDEKISAELGVSDWRQEINKGTNWQEVHNKKWHIIDMTHLIAKEFTCAGCGKTRRDTWYKLSWEGKEFCDFSCEELYKKKHGQEKKDYYFPKKHELEDYICVKCHKYFPEKERKGWDYLCASCQVNQDNGRHEEIKKEIRNLKTFMEEKLGGGEEEWKTSYNRITGKTEKVRVSKEKVNPLFSLLDWMRKEGVTNISFDGKKLVIELDNRGSRSLNDNELTSEQRELKNFFQSNPSKKTNISRSELEQEVANFAPTNSPNSGGDSKAGIIAAIVVLGLIVAIVIGFVIGQKKRKGY